MKKEFDIETENSKLMRKITKENSKSPLIWNYKGTEIKIVSKIDVNHISWCRNAYSFTITKGKCALCWKGIPIPDWRYYDHPGAALDTHHIELMLNDTPLLLTDRWGCFTCGGLIYTGYGIENADCIELTEISEKINSEYDGLENAFANILPVLGLLQDGSYTIMDCNVFPSDGSSHYFWDVRNSLFHAAIQETPYFRERGSRPAFIYPSQGTDKFNEERAEYYRRMLLFGQGKYPAACGEKRKMV